MKKNSYISQHFPKILTATSAILLISGTVAFAISQAGTNSDPLISQSYAESTYKNDILNKIETSTQNQLDSIQADLDNKLSQLNSNYTDDAVKQELAKQVASLLGNTKTTTSVKTTSQSFTNGTQLQLAKTTEICLTSGSAVISSGELINITTGNLVKSGDIIVRNQLYMSPSASNTIKLTSPAKVDINGNYTQINGTSPAYTAKYTAYADALNDLGLFAGSTNGYELERASNRTEGLVMLIRMLGEESRALNYKGSHPFTDVPAWADRYVAYAYEKGYTSGIGNNLFGASNTLSLNDYMTFLLRALEYNDKNGDFSWSSAGQSAVTAGILTQAELDTIKSHGILYRDDIVYASYNTLFTSCKNETFRLCDKLISANVFTKNKLELIEKSLSQK